MKQGAVRAINGNMVAVTFDGSVMQNEVAFVLTAGKRLKSEVIKIQRDVAYAQVFESTKGVRVGDVVEFSGHMLSVTLGPGILGQIYDGLQNPLPELAAQCGFFLPQGVELYPLDKKKVWHFTPAAQAGAIISAGQALGWVQEGIFKHYIMAPFGIAYGSVVASCKPEGDYAITEEIARITDAKGNERVCTMVFDWPVKVPIKAYKEKTKPQETLITKARIIDTFFPVARGGTYCVPGPFGAGKTVLQQLTSRYAEVDIVIIAACGERAGEVVETLREFPHLTDPRTGKSLMERTIIICNTSSMPVAAREASVYTAATLGEYYRQMGLHVLLLADSTSRWAQAMREMSGRLEEIPGEEAFPAYLESRIAEFYERAGVVVLADNRLGSLTIGGTVSPAGGNFDEPVTQATLKVVGAFHGLSRDRANARKFPSIDPLDSWSRYTTFIDEKAVHSARAILRRGSDVNQMMKVVGEEGTSIEDFIVYLKAEFLDGVYLQQNAFDEVDSATDRSRQAYVFGKVYGVLAADYIFAGKEEARKFFYGLRQLYIDWNYKAFESPEFAQQQARIEEYLAQIPVPAKTGA